MQPGISRQGEAKGRSLGIAAKIALSYSVFLLLCLALVIWLYCLSNDNARADFWRQREVRLESDVAVVDNYLSMMDGYVRQLLNDSTFVRFSNMKDVSERGYVSTAYEVKEKLADRLFSLANIPIRESHVHIYLKNTGYVISASQFSEGQQFYKDYMSYQPDQYGLWLQTLLTAGPGERIVDAKPFTGKQGQYWLLRDVDAILPRRVPAVIWFEWDVNALSAQFLPDGTHESAFVLAMDGDGDRLLLLKGDGADAAAIDGLTAAASAAPAMLNSLHVLQCVSEHNGWRYLMAVPEAVCDQALGNYDLPFYCLLVLALLGGAAIVVVLVRQNMRPIAQLNRQLTLVEGDRAQLLEEMDSQRPALCAAYLRQILSGHVASDDEFSYIMRYLGLDGNLRFLVLYGTVYGQTGDGRNPADAYALLEERLPHHLPADWPLHYYTTFDHSYVILTAYDDTVVDPLMELQKRVIALHDDLLTSASLWFYAGVGKLCTEPRKLWESYEQARDAARYTTKQHVFLPYEVIRKQSDSVYYPVEISAKLQHFITTGNKPQVSELFALIHHENVEERSLPVNLLNFLLSDIKNTLLRARFSITPKTAADQQRLSEIDERLAPLPTFTLCESTALMLCDFFAESAEPSDPIPEIKTYLCENFADPSMCLSKLSERFHISESYLSHLFKERTGQNFSVYLEELRLGEAARRLRSGGSGHRGKEQNLTTLYLELGYNNATTFRRAFKKRYGITPSEMRGEAR